MLPLKTSDAPAILVIAAEILPPVQLSAKEIVHFFSFNFLNENFG